MVLYGGNVTEAERNGREENKKAETKKKKGKMGEEGEITRRRNNGMQISPENMRALTTGQMYTRIQYYYTVFSAVDSRIWNCTHTHARLETIAGRRNSALPDRFYSQTSRAIIAYTGLRGCVRDSDDAAAKIDCYRRRGHLVFIRLVIVRCYHNLLSSLSLFPDKRVLRVSRLLERNLGPPRTHVRR